MSPDPHSFVKGWRGHGIDYCAVCNERKSHSNHRDGPDPRVPMAPKTEAPTPTEALRQKVRAKIGTCPTCGRSGLSLRDAAAQIGPPIGAPLLSRFLRGAPIHSDSFDLLTAWVEKP